MESGGRPFTAAGAATEVPAELDTDIAKTAFNQLVDELRAIPQDKVQSTRPDLQQAAVFVLGRMKRLGAMQARARFALLPKEIFAIEHYDRLESVAGAAFYAQLMFDSAQAIQSDAKVSLEVVEESTLLLALATPGDVTKMRRRCDISSMLPGYPSFEQSSCSSLPRCGLAPCLRRSPFNPRIAQAKEHTKHEMLAMLFPAWAFMRS